MKHLRKFNENWQTRNNKPADYELAQEIADDLLPRLQEMRSKGEKMTLRNFDAYMEERGSSIELSDAVMHILVDKGFNFDSEEDESLEETFY